MRPLNNASPQRVSVLLFSFTKAAPLVNNFIVLPSSLKFDEPTVLDAGGVLPLTLNVPVTDPESVTV